MSEPDPANPRIVRDYLHVHRNEDDPLQFIEVEVRLPGNSLIIRSKIPYTNDDRGQFLLHIDQLRIWNLIEDIQQEQMHIKKRTIVSVFDDGTGKPLDRTILIEEEPKP